jgi:hypothetical protein
MNTQDPIPFSATQKQQEHVMEIDNYIVEELLRTPTQSDDEFDLYDIGDGEVTRSATPESRPDFNFTLHKDTDDHFDKFINDKNNLECFQQEGDPLSFIIKRKREDDNEILQQSKRAKIAEGIVIDMDKPLSILNLKLKDLVKSKWKIAINKKEKAEPGIVLLKNFSPKMIWDPMSPIWNALDQMHLFDREGKYCNAQKNDFYKMVNYYRQHTEEAKEKLKEAITIWLCEVLSYSSSNANLHNLTFIQLKYMLLTSEWIFKKGKYQGKFRNIYFQKWQQRHESLAYVASICSDTVSEEDA